MPFSFRKTLRLGRGLSLTLSRSGPSLSARKGRFSLTSRGRASVRLEKGLSFRTKIW